MVPEEVRDAYAASALFFQTPLQQFQFFDKYSRYDYAQGRRETWIETVDRALGFLATRATLPSATWARLRQAILEMRVMPSMRLLATAGAAAQRNNIALYNCSYQPVDDLRAFSEALLISMSGCGVGFSVERQYVSQLPKIAPLHTAHKKLITVEDTTEGWQAALLDTLETLFGGQDVMWDTSAVRPAGTPLKTKGGVASGPEPFLAALTAIRRVILARAGQALRPLDAHDLMCLVGNAAVSGGHRRTAMISLFDVDDQEMLAAKQPGFDTDHPERWNANNSAVWEQPPTQAAFLAQLSQLFAGGTGEPGIFSRLVADATRPARRAGGHAWGTNPCGEIVLRPFEFCNLSAVIARPADTLDTLREKVELATLLGTIQSLFTHFPGLRPQWAANCNEERLLGVDITGQLDCPAVQDPQVMRALQAHAQTVNQTYAAQFGIPASAAITCVKPSGNTSQLVDCASGLHARWAPYYIRNVRVSTHSPIFGALRDAGVPLRPENGQTPEHAVTWVVPFPVKAPEGAITRNDRTAVQQCDYWLQNKRHWTEHNPSVTITYRPHEILDLVAWLWAHQTELGGMAFLPAFDAHYDQLPYIEITADEYAARAAAFPPIDFAQIYRYEQTDQTQASSTLACESDLCLLTAGA